MQTLTLTFCLSLHCLPRFPPSFSLWRKARRLSCHTSKQSVCMNLGMRLNPIHYYSSIPALGAMLVAALQSHGCRQVEDVLRPDATKAGEVFWGGAGELHLVLLLILHPLCDPLQVLPLHLPGRVPPHLWHAGVCSRPSVVANLARAVPQLCRLDRRSALSQRPNRVIQWS